MAIRDGDFASSDEVLNNCIGTPFKNQAQLLYNSAYIGFNSKLNVATGVPNLKNVKYDVMLTDTATTKTNFTYDNTNKLYYQDLGAANGVLEFRTTSLPTITDCIPTWNSEIDSENTLTVSISADGTNYEEVTDATIHRFTNTGTNLFIKFEIDRVNTSAVDKISEYAILYNITGDTA